MDISPNFDCLQSPVKGVMCDLPIREKGGWRSIIYLIPLIITVSVAVISDYRGWRIPNKLIGAGLIQGFVVSAVWRGLQDGLVCSIQGCVIPVMMLFVLFLIRALGAGDIKLLAVAGAFVGTGVYRVMIYSFLAGGVISIIYLLKEIILSITNRNKLSDKTSARKLVKARVHFSAAIFAGVVCYAGTISAY